MGYRLTPDESTTHGLRRVARRELAAAADDLRQSDPPAATTIHGARKHLKKVRAIVDLIDADHGSGLADVDKRLRAVNRTLSELRDAEAILKTLTALKRREPRLFTARGFASLRRRLTLHYEGLLDAAERDGAWKRLARELRAMRRQASAWRPSHRRFGAIAEGIRAAHRRGRKALTRAQQKARAADYHEWRKAVKTLWYELRLVEKSGPGVRRAVTALHRAEQWLGEDHDLVVFCENLTKTASAGDNNEVNLDRLRRAADRRQAELRTKAVAATRRLYARDSDEYVRGVKRAWKAWTQDRYVGRRYSS